MVQACRAPWLVANSSMAARVASRAMSHHPDRLHDRPRSWHPRAVQVNRLTWTVVLVLIATARLAGAQGAKVAKEFQRPSQGVAIVRKGHGPPLTYASCQLAYTWTKRQLDGTVMSSGVEHGELDIGRRYHLGVDVTLSGMQLGETRRHWTGQEIVDIAMQEAKCPSLPNGLRIEPGAVIRQGLRGALDIAASPDGGSPVVRSVKLSGSAVVVDYFMSESLAEWTEQYPMTQLEARLAHAQAQLDLKAGRPRDAERKLRRALALEPTLSAAAIELAEMLLTAGKRDDALAAVTEVSRTRAVWLYRQILDHPVLAPLRDLPALRAALTTNGDARWDGGASTEPYDRAHDGGAFTVAYSPALDAFAVKQTTDFDGNSGGSWVDFIGADGKPQTSIDMVSCMGADCSGSPERTELLNRMLADLGFTKGEAGQNAVTDGTQGCRYRFASVHIGVVCGKDHVRVVQRDTVLIEQALQGYHYTFAVRFPGIVALGTWSDGYGHQTITGLQILRSPTIP